MTITETTMTITETTIDNVANTDALLATNCVGERAP